MQLTQGLVITTLAVEATALGINCLGSGQCVVSPPQTAETILDFVQGIDNSRTYENGEHIACSSNICAFLQGTGGITGDLIKELVQDLVNFQCDRCGSVPVFFNAGDDDINDHGELTLNRVEDTFGCNGLC
jgi:hypothetical protein